MCEDCCTLKRCCFGRWLPPPASAEKRCSTSASVFVPTTYLNSFLFKQKSPYYLLHYAILTHSRTNGRRERAGDTETKVNFKSSFLFFYASPKQICFRSSRCCFFPASLVRLFVPIAQILRTYWSQRPEALFSEDLFFQRTLVRPSFRPSRTSYPSTTPSERDVEKGRSPLFLKELPRGASCAGGPLTFSP